MNRPADDTSRAERINVSEDQALHSWAKKLDASPEQIKEAVRAVGDCATDVEAHLKGSRSTTNSDRTHEALKPGGKGDGTSAGERPQ